MKKVKEGFPPIANKNAMILILGSMPSEESLRKQEYYGHPRNAFWKIMSRLIGFDHEQSYEKRTNKLTTNNIAVWDVLHSCERPGSLDSSIKDDTIIKNDFVAFYRNHPSIKHIFFNGIKAEKEYCKRVLPILSNENKKIRTIRLPSTSPAMAGQTFEEKLLAWSLIKQVLDKNLQHQNFGESARKVSC